MGREVRECRRTIIQSGSVDPVSVEHQESGGYSYRNDYGSVENRIGNIGFVIFDRRCRTGCFKVLAFYSFAVNEDNTCKNHPKEKCKGNKHAELFAKLAFTT